MNKLDKVATDFYEVAKDVIKIFPQIKRNIQKRL